MNTRKTLSHLLLLLLALALPGLTPAVEAQDSPLAVIVKVQGSAEYVPAGGGGRPAAVGTPLSVGDRLVPAQGGSVVVVHRTGATQVVDQPVTLEAPPAGDRPGVFARTVEVLAQAASTETRTELNRQGMIRPIPGEPVLLSPRNGLTVLETAPEFHWYPVEGATGYRIQIRKLGDPPMRFEVEGDTALSLAEEGVSLEAGAEYAWTVGPLGTGRATREQRFRVAGEDLRGEVETDMEALTAMGLPPGGDGAFLAATLLRDRGLPYSVLSALEVVESGSSALGAEFYLLKGDVLLAVGRETEADEAFDTADRMMR